MPPTNRKQPVNAPSSESEYTILEFIKEFPDDETCLQWLWHNRYADDGEHAHCPKCKRERSFKRYQTKQQRQSWTCQGCGYHLHPTAGTIFHKSSTSLQLWFYAMYLITSTRCGISAKQLERELGVNYKTAYRMYQKIRKELMTQDDPDKLSGDVELDETYVGGHRKGKYDASKGPTAHLTPVFGMVERGGRVRAVVVPSVQKGTLFPIIDASIKRQATRIHHDDARVYDRLGKDAGYTHAKVNHSRGVYVSGTVHTNTIEGFWSNMKRGLDGVYHHVSPKHLQGYLNEYVWRYNQRLSGRDRFGALLLRAVVR